MKLNHTLKILVIEDELIDQKIIKRAINNSGIISEVQIVDSSKSAFELIKSQQFDCIFIDYLLPELNGIEVVKKLASMGVKSPMVIITSQTDEQLAQLAIAAGATNYLTKSLISPEGISLIIRNSLSINQIQNELEAAKNKAEKAVKVKDEFLSNMSHEIRTPLNAIIGFNDLLKQSTLDPEQEKYVEIVKVASQNLLVIINDILDVSKMESGVIELEERPINIKEVAENVINLQYEKAKNKGLKLLLSFDQSIPEYIIGDSTRISQILINLVGNAIKFTNEGSVELRIMETSRDGNGTVIKFSVKDTGIGIEKTKQGRVFERFTQAESATTRIYGGTGLGLNICQKLVDLYNGKIELQSELGIGSEFNFEICFPIASAEQLSLNAFKDDTNKITSKNQSVLAGKSILIVEDNEHNQILAATYLKKNGASVEIAENGAIGVEKLRNNTFDLVVMDLEMPVMDGFTATRIIRNELKLATPIIGCSANSLVSERQNCINHGMNDLLPKPYTEINLIEVLASFLKALPSHVSDQTESLRPNDIDTDDFKKILATLEKKNGKEFIDMMLEVYRRRIPLDKIKLENALEKQDIETIKSISHLLVGSLSSMNFDKGCQIAKDLEKSVIANEKEKINELTNSLISYFKHSLEIIG